METVEGGSAASWTGWGAAADGVATTGSAAGWAAGDG